MATELLFVRHGHSVANREGFYAGKTDVALTEIGEEQAKRAAAYIKEHYAVDAVYASCLQRAWRTAEEIASGFGLGVTRVEALHEIAGGDWEAMHFEDIGKAYPDEFARWKTAIHTVRPPHGETLGEVQTRGLTAVGEIAEQNDGKTVVIVAHRVLLRALQCAWEKRPIEEANACAWLSNCSVSEVRYENGVLIPKRVGIDDFMGELITRVTTSM